MDVTRYLEARIAPAGVFDDLEDRNAWVRFKVPASTPGSGSGWTDVTFGEFAEEIRLLGLFLLESGFVSGDRACVFAPNSVAWASAAMAIQAVGGVMVPTKPPTSSNTPGPASSSRAGPQLSPRPRAPSATAPA
jgi:long-chain acyl-CoA synthetase